MADGLVAAVLPASRAVPVGSTATAFATIISTSSTPATGCSIALPAGLPATFNYQTTNPATNAVTGTQNTPVSLAAGASQTFVFSVKPFAAFPQTDIPLTFSCTSGQSATAYSGINTFLLTSSNTATPDIVALAATVSNDGVVRTPGTVGAAAFSVATVNVGAAGSVTASVDTGGASVPASYSLCQTNAQAACLQPPSASVNASFAANGTGTFSVFVAASGTAIPLDPARTRLFVRFRTADGGSVGATSVALQTQVTLASGGGTLQIGPVTVQAPSQAAYTGVDFSAAAGSLPSPLPGGFTALGPVYEIGASNPSAPFNAGLNGAVNLTVSYAGLGVGDPSMLAVMHYDAATGQYDPTTIQAIDTAAQTITFDSRQFSSFVLALVNAALPSSGGSGFNPVGVDGFQIQNTGQVYLSPNGNCLGMAAFSLWYYKNAGPLYNHYAGPANTQSLSSTANLVATRAYLQQSAYWTTYSGTSAFATQWASPGVTQAKLRAYLSLLQRPVVLIVGPAGSPTAHAVLAYAYDAAGIKIYDPNHPSSVVNLPYNANGFGAYGTGEGYTAFSIIGAPTFGGGDSFRQIANDGNAGFASSNGISLSTPAQGSTTSNSTATLQGSLSSSLNQNGVPAFYFLDGGTSPIGVTGSPSSFSSTLPVQGGTNSAVLVAGVPFNGGAVDSTLANAAILVRTFNGPAGIIFRSILQWNQANTDLDLYVTEPTGATAWYNGKTTSGGLVLDVDNTSGLGPEDITLTAGHAPIPGNYAVRVHYYSDHATGQAVSGTVKVVLYEGNAAKLRAPPARSFTLSISSPSNQMPDASGADWVNIALVDVVNDTVTFQ